MKIKVKLLEAGALPKIIKKGDWIDLRSRFDYNGQAPKNSPQMEVLSLIHR
jgi:hypothetical protein